MIDKQTIGELREQAEAERKRAYGVADALYKERIRTLEWMQASPNGSEKSTEIERVRPSPKSAGLAAPVPASNKWPGFRAAIKEAIDARGRERFTVNDIIEYVTNAYPGRELSHVSSELWRLNKQHKIIQKKKGAGRNPSVYVAAHGSDEDKEEQQDEA